LPLTVGQIGGVDLVLHTPRVRYLPTRPSPLLKPFLIGDHAEVGAFTYNAHRCRTVLTNRGFNPARPETL
jgi:hypothetical protein